ncbi:MAG: hypothetical protein KKG99_05880 [Bacteroidetes bacterium]|nr:hypothetical protein [Bacteroidota bacterium]
MKTFQEFKKTLISMMGLVLILFLVQCSKNVGPIDRDDLVLPDGEHALIIKTSSSKIGESISSYQLKIQSPSGTQNVSPTSGSYTITELTNGLYTITSSKDGYIGQSVQFNVILPGDRTSDYSAQVELLLTKSTPPVVVNNLTGGQVVAPPIGNGTNGTGSNSATMTIPAGAITGTGTTSISFTQIPPVAGNNNPAGLKSVDTDFGTKTSAFVITPVTTFSTPVSIEFSLNFSQAMLSKGITARLYEYNENWVTTGQFVNVVISNGGLTGTVQISRSGYWAVVESWEAVFTTGTYSQSFTSGCSEALNAPFSYAKGYGPEYSARMQIAASTVTVSTVIQAPAALWFTRSATINVPTRNYVMRNKANLAVIETVNGIPQSALSYSIAYSASDCHDSGGHDSGGN